MLARPLNRTAAPEQTLRQKIGLIAHDALRVEPYTAPLKVIAHE